MKYAADFRRIARDALRGKWPIAVLTGFIASLMGAGIATGGGGSGSGSDDSTGAMVQEFQATELWLQLRTIIFAAIAILVIWVIITIVISGAVKLGYAIFNLKLVDHREVALSDLFSQRHRLGDGFCMNFLVGLFTLLWTLLFVIPGVVKQFSYAMTPYILAENPGMTATESITESRRIMDGNKWRLFCLDFSFIGWDLLCATPALIVMAILTGSVIRSGNFTTFLYIIPCGIPSFIGSLFLNAYREAAYAAFYRDVTYVPQPEVAETFEGNSMLNEKMY